MVSWLSLLCTIVMVSVLTCWQVTMMMVIMTSLDMEMGWRRNRLETMELMLLEMVLMVGRGWQQSTGHHAT